MGAPMSPESDRLRYEQILRSLLAGRARIVRCSMQQDWPARPLGRGNARPIFWVNRADAISLMDSGELVVTNSGLDLSPATRARLEGRSRLGEAAGTLKTPKRGPGRPTSLPAQSQASKSSKLSPTTSTITLLSRRRDTNRKPLLTEGQVAAAERHTRDLIRAGEGHVSTSDPSAPRVDGTRRHDSAEDAALARIDASRALADARAAVGPDLSRLLTCVCRDNERLVTIERAESWSSGTGIAILRMALDRLAIHYAERSKPAPDPSGDTMRVWRQG